MWSIGRSEAALDGRVAGADRNPASCAPPGGCGCGSTKQRFSQADLPGADEPARGSRLGARSARMDRGAARPRRSRRSHSRPARSFRSRAGTSGWSGTRVTPRTPDVDRRRTALRRAGDGFEARSQLFLKRQRSRRCQREVADFAMAAGVASPRQHRRRRDALGQLLVARPDPAELAADPRPARGPTICRRA